MVQAGRADRHGHGNGQANRSADGIPCQVADGGYVKPNAYWLAAVHVNAHADPKQDLDGNSIAYDGHADPSSSNCNAHLYGCARFAHCHSNGDDDERAANGDLNRDSDGDERSTDSDRDGDPGASHRNLYPYTRPAVRDSYGDERSADRDRDAFANCQRDDHFDLGASVALIALAAHSLS